MYQLLQNEGRPGDVAYMLTLKPFRRVSVLQLNIKHNGTCRVKDTIVSLVQHLPKKPDRFRSYEILAEMHMQDGELDEAVRVIEDAKMLDKSAKYQRKVVGRLFKLLKRYKEKSK